MVKTTDKFETKIKLSKIANKYKTPFLVKKSPEKVHPVICKHPHCFYWKTLMKLAMQQRTVKRLESSSEVEEIEE